MPSPFTYWSARFLFGLALLLASGISLPSKLAEPLFGHGGGPVVDWLIGLFGFLASFTAVTPLVRVIAADARLRREWGSTAHSAFARASTPQRVFLLLLAVAEADGTAGPSELELVRSFLHSRFVDPRQRRDLDDWRRGPRPPRDLTELARLVARDLGQGERATIYSWSCLVAFADGALRGQEFRALQQIALGLGIAPHHAMFLFEFAQQAANQQRRSRTQSNQYSGKRDRAAGSGTGSSARTTASPTSVREQSFATLGLPTDASAEAIRHRHRELVRRFHPDKHRTLGPIAQQEATERFVAIQRAYEVLTGG